MCPYHSPASGKDRRWHVPWVQVRARGAHKSWMLLAKWEPDPLMPQAWAHTRQGPRDWLSLETPSPGTGQSCGDETVSHYGSFVKTPQQNWLKGAGPARATQFWQVLQIKGGLEWGVGGHISFKAHFSEIWMLRSRWKSFYFSKWDLHILITLLRYNSYIKQFIHLELMIQRLLIHSELYIHYHNLNLQHSISKRNSYQLAVTSDPLSPLHPQFHCLLWGFTYSGHFI